MPHRLTPFLLLPLLIVVWACSNATETSTPDTSRQSMQAPASSQSTPTIEGPSTTNPSPTLRQAVQPTSTPTPSITSPQENTEGNLSEDAQWVTDRVRAVESLYDITAQGREAIENLDVRWMKDQPGFFGSYGYRHWTGVGEAIPKSVMHELSHAYWGMFPVTGFPHLSWDTEEGQTLSTAMARYHQDVLEFIKQPPDHYELLRSRLRNLPQLSSSNPEPLLHTIEADAVYTTAGDLNLIPPILRKYWDNFLQAGPFHSWNEAFRWYQSMPPLDQRLADKYMGLEHFSLENYDGLGKPELSTLRPEVAEILLGEERQRLKDFVQHFDLLSALIVGTEEQTENFKFWRRYLRDKINLHKQHPELVASLTWSRADPIADAMDFLRSLEGKDSGQKVDLVIQELAASPFLVHFLPALDNGTLLTLFTCDVQLPEGATLKGTTSFVESLKRLAPHADRVLEEGRRDASRGAEVLMSYLDSVSFDKQQDLDLFFEILQDSDNRTARGVVTALDDLMLRRLLKPLPARLKGLLSTTRFLRFLNITQASSAEKLAQGIEDMVQYPSGNFLIEEPFLDEMYSVIVSRAERAPLETLNVMADSPFPVERFLALHPESAVELLAIDLDITSTMIKNSDPIILSPARFVHRLISANPRLAAQVVSLLDDEDQTSLVVESLAHFAYDADRLLAVPTLPIFLEKDGQFLETLLKMKGKAWLETHLEEVVSLYGQRVERKEVGSDFLAAYERTLISVVATLDDVGISNALKEIIDRVFLGVLRVAKSLSLFCPPFQLC